MPHGHCFFWQPSVLWTHVVSDSLIALAYYSIPITLLYFIRHRTDSRLRGLLLMFAGFILACGTTHILSIWDIWHSAYRLEGLMKAITAALSVATAIVTIRVTPIALKIAFPEQRSKINETLRGETGAREQAEEMLRHRMEASEEKLSACFEAASQAILAVSADGRISLVNRRTEEMFGYSRQELLGQELEILLPHRFRHAHIAHRDGYFREPRVRAMGAGLDLAGRHKNGTEFPVEIGLGHVNTPEGPLAFGMVNDISERKRAVSELERVNQELRRTNTDMEQFAHVASHDLQEPLRMVTGYLQLIERRYASHLDDDGREFIGFAVDGARRMKVLIQDLLEFSRAGSADAKFREAPVGYLLQNALDNLKTAIEESGADITSDPLPTLVVEPILLTQVFQNLVANAIKFREEGNQPRIHISVEHKGSEHIFSVKDNGIGIESRHLDRIFRIFERLHTTESYAGSGIGLAIARKIVERHGGTIWVESQTGIGSTFFFSISSETAIAKAAK